MKIKRSQAGVTCGVAVLVLALAGCGGGAREARELSGISVLEKTKPLGQNLVTQSDINKTSDTSGVKTLLQFWLALQYQDYESATGFFYPRLANFVGVAQLALALRNEGSLWGSTKPDVVEATTSGHTARVIFAIHDLVGNVTPVTVSFRKLGTVWKINYLTLLDEALRAWDQQRTQIESAPTSSHPTKQGLAAGVRALQLQSQYLQAERSETVGSETGGAGKAGARKAGKTG
ncbi:MAG: hypothetical protein WA484_06500 [Solirubrobacteraceae bacterium]